MNNIEVSKPSESLGVSLTLKDLLNNVKRAIEIYGPDTEIYAYNTVKGIAMHAHFPRRRPHLRHVYATGEKPHLSRKLKDPASLRASGANAARPWGGVKLLLRPFDL